MGFTSRMVDFSIRALIKPYLKRVDLDSHGLARIRQLAEICMGVLKGPLNQVYISRQAYPEFDVEVITPRQGSVLGTMLYCPGGGYICCSPRTHRNLTVRLAAQNNIQVHVVNYSKIPEFSVSNAISEMLGVYRRVLSGRPNMAQKIIFAGDSAGGHLALSSALAAVQEGLPMPNGLICMSPWTDLSCPDEGRFHQHLDPLLPLNALRVVAEMCLAGEDAHNQILSPLHGDLTCLPPTLVQTVESELLYHDATRLVARAKEVGASAYLSTWQGVPHCFQLFAPYLPQAVAALDEISYFIATQLDTANPMCQSSHFED